MTELTQILSSLPTLLWTAFIEFRLFNRIFEKRLSMPLTIAVMLAVDLVSGWFNLHFHLVGTVPGNEFYYGTISFLLYTLLFKGSKIKILFFTIVLLCSAGVVIYMILPFCYSYGGNDIEKTLTAINGAALFSMILYSIFLEYMGLRFQNLRHDLPKDYMVYLMITMIFVYMAIAAVQEVALMWCDGILKIPVALGCFIFAAVGTALVVAAVFAVDRQATALLRQQKSELQAENYKCREEEWRRIAGFKHDFKNHLICLNGLIVQGRMKEAESYTIKLSDTVEQLENKVHTGNEYADAILGAKYNEALVKGIRISVDMIIPPEIPVEPADLCCILSNVTDNAIEECENLAEEERWISMRSFIRQQQLVIEVKNSLSSEVKICNGKIVTSKRGTDHGFGLDNIHAAVDKYNGVMDMTAEEWFTLSILLPINRL